MAETTRDSRIRANYQEESETAWLYRTLAEQTHDTTIAAVMHASSGPCKGHRGR